ncbi:MAG: TonB family protein [Prevotella sp.]|nr:TonB family protein [Prevotella sp.]
MATLLLFTCGIINANILQSNPQEEVVYESAEKMPEFNGGINALFNYLSTSIHYPKDAEKNKIEGRVLVNFIVEKDGSVSHVEVQQKAYPTLDQEAVRVVKEMPTWKPGTNKGKPVRVKYALPIMFKLK